MLETETKKGYRETARSQKSASREQKNKSVSTNNQSQNFIEIQDQICDERMKDSLLRFCLVKVSR